MVHAWYTASRKSKFVTVYQDFNRRDGKRICVTGLAEARKVAAAHGAKAWNF